MGRQGAVALVVGIAALGSAGHDGVGRDKSQFQQHGVDRLFHPFCGEGGAVLFQTSQGSDPRLPDELDAGSEAGFGGALRPGDLPDLPGLLDLALVEEGPLLDPDAKSAAAQLKGQACREVEGDQQGAHSPAGQHPVQHRRRGDGPAPSRRSSCWSPDRESTSSTRAWRRARSISRSFITTWERPPCRKQAKGSGAKKRVA